MNFWNERYAAEEYAYGTEPNDFLKQELDRLKPGKILLPGEGEGRNAVYAARQGWQVLAFDSSSEGKKKAEKLAVLHQVSINYLIDHYDEIELPVHEFDCLALIYTHMPAAERREYHRKLAASLKPGGTLILEGFSKEQIHNDTGGPKSVEMLFSREELEADFSEFFKLSISQLDLDIREGLYHNGKASVIQLVAVK
ncbi:class I SAM-dependent methyltransferase [Gaoshiqia sp. Z1-71]|uniref:class I SAM-dependent methyltransferase n=1 Tax=Gaoshiqia hydrogeniformans TaxID=3290090 RepID=UPI003BF8D382